MEINEGDVVEHLDRPEWGDGYVLELRGPKVRILFPNCGEKQLLLSHARLRRKELDEEEAARWSRLTRPTDAYRNLEELVQIFLHFFEAGLEDDQYLKMERKPKIGAHELFKEKLNRETYLELIEGGDFAEAVKRIQLVYNLPAFRMLATYELIQLNDALKPEANRELFATALYDSLYSDGGPEESFNVFAECLERLEIAKWPIQTCVHFFAFPKEHIFLKPSVAKKVAEVCAFDLNYRPQPNWLTYSCYLELGCFLQDELSKRGEHLRPRDMIDVHTFIWVTGGGYEVHA